MKAVLGRLEGVPVMVMEGRFHQYEGYPLKKITLPVRVMKRLGAKLLIVSQAVGGLNTMYRAGDVMIGLVRPLRNGESAVRTAAA